MSRNLFDDPPEVMPLPAVAADSPLAERMRPRTLTEVLGQAHLSHGIEFISS